jgi:hypothetical protein
MAARKGMALGYIAAFTVVLITSAYPAVTRLGVATTLTPADLLLFRLGVSGLLFVPYLVRHAREIRKSIGCRRCRFRSSTGGAWRAA